MWGGDWVGRGPAQLFEVMVMFHVLMEGGHAFVKLIKWHT